MADAIGRQWENNRNGGWLEFDGDFLLMPNIERGKLSRQQTPNSVMGGIAKRTEYHESTHVRAHRSTHTNESTQEGTHLREQTYERTHFRAHI